MVSPNYLVRVARFQVYQVEDNCSLTFVGMRWCNYRWQLHQNGKTHLEVSGCQLQPPREFNGATKRQ